MPNAKRKVYTMPRLRQQNKGTDTGGYRAKELPAILPQMPQADIDKCITTAEVPDAKTQSR